MSVLEVNNASIRYMTGDFKDIGLKEYVTRRLTHNYSVTEFWADRDVSFSLEKGDMLGIIGSNGAGKSTLLKAVAGIMEPTYGSVRREGSIAALLELGSGFDGDLTVRENTYLRGALLGYTRKFMDDTYDSIIEFAELQNFQDRPFKQLSSGMQSRLAFSIASLVRPDILILDEVLSVGDGAFRKKSEEKMKEIIRGGATTILVSHSLDQVREMCTKVLWLHKGEQIAFGEDVQGICDRYEDFLAGKIELPKRPVQEAEEEVKDAVPEGEAENEEKDRFKQGAKMKINNSVQREFSKFKSYVLQNRWWILLSSTLLLCVYSGWLISPDLHIDADAYIMNQGSRWGGGEIGRQGMTLINILLGMQNFNPYFECMAGWLAHCVAGVLMGFVLYRFGLNAPVLCAMMGPLVFISPVNGVNYYNYSRLVVLAAGYMLCTVAVGLSYYGLFKKKKLVCLLSILCMIWAFCIHQSYVMVYVVFSIVAFLLVFRRWTLRGKNSDIPYFSVVIKQIVLFALAYGLNTAITYIFFFSDDKFNDLVMFWGTVPFSQSVRNILSTIRNGFLGKAYYTTGLYGVLGSLTVVAAAVECWQKRKEVKKLYLLIYFAAVIFLPFCPYLMAIYEGGEPAVHGQLAYPIVLAVEIVFLAGFTIETRKKGSSCGRASAKAVAAVIAAILLWNSSQTVMRLIYTDSIRVEEDKNTAHEITARIHEVSDEKKPVVFIGIHICNLNPAVQQGEYMTPYHSVLGWDHGFEPHYLISSRRTVQFFNTMALGLTSVSDEETVMRARKTALEMPAWPAADSVVDAGDCVIVKLCEDEWPEEVLEPSADQVKLEEYPVNGEIGVHIESIETADGNLIIQGIVDQPNDDYASWKPQLYLFDIRSEKAYALSTSKKGDPWQIIDGATCPNSTFTAMAPSQVLDDLEDYIFLFEYRDQNTGESFWVLPQAQAGIDAGLDQAGLPDEQTPKKTDIPLNDGFHYSNVKINDSLELVSNGAEGCILWGPYSESVPGTYNITLHYSVDSFTDSDEGTFDIALDTEQAAEARFTSQETAVTIESVTIEEGHEFEARVWVPAGMIVRVQSIEYERVG